MSKHNLTIMTAAIFLASCSMPPKVATPTGEHRVPINNAGTLTETYNAAYPPMQQSNYSSTPLSSSRTSTLKGTAIGSASAASITDKSVNTHSAPEIEATIADLKKQIATLKEQISRQVVSQTISSPRTSHSVKTSAAKTTDPTLNIQIPGTTYATSSSSATKAMHSSLAPANRTEHSHATSTAQSPPITTNPTGAMGSASDYPTATSASTPVTIWATSEPTTITVPAAPTARNTPKEIPKDPTVFRSVNQEPTKTSNQTITINKKLAKLLKNPNKHVVMHDEAVIFTIPHEVGQSNFLIPKEMKTVLLELAKTSQSIEVRGYTDSDKDDEKNNEIALARAVAAYDFLVHNGVTPNQIYVSYESSGYFTAENNTAKGKARNRRVEIEVLGSDTTYLR